MSNASQLIAHAIAEAPEACRSGRGKELLLSLHAALARDAAEAFFLRKVATETSFDEVAARLENVVDAHVKAILETYAEHGLMDRALFTQGVDVVFAAFHGRLSPFASGMSCNGIGRREALS